MNQSKGKEMKRLAVAAASVLLMLGTAQAQSRAPLYGELGYSFLEIKGDDGFKVKPHALRGIIGYEFHPNVAAEGMLAFGVRSDDVNFAGGSADVKLRHAFGVFVKPKFNFGPAEVFARLGYARIKVKSTECVTGLGCASFSDSDGDVAWGLGANYNFNPRMYVGADWMRLNDSDGGKVQGITISFGYRF
jgi:opacity protein-like surface antigen